MGDNIIKATAGLLVLAALSIQCWVGKEVVRGIKYGRIDHQERFLNHIDSLIDDSVTNSPDTLVIKAKKDKPLRTTPPIQIEYTNCD